MKSVLLLVGVALGLVWSAVGGETIPVHDGEELTAAIKQIIKMRKADSNAVIDVVLASGDYNVPASLRLDGRYGFRSSDAQLTFRAAPRAQPRLCGGTPVKDWRKTSFNGRDDVWVADVAALKLKAQLPLFYYDGTSMTLCRYPNADAARPYSGGWAYVPGKPVNMYRDLPDERDDLIPVRPEDWHAWSNPTEGLVNIFPRYNWWNAVKPILEVDPTNHVIVLAKRIREGFAPRPQDRYHLMGLREELDAPGEWYHDLKGGKLYFITPKGEDPNTKRTAVLADTHAVFDLARVRNIALKGLEICEAGAGVSGSAIRGCLVEACRIHDVGFFDGNAVGLSGTENTVRDCDIWNCGAYGISVTAGWSRLYAPETRDGNVVENNYIHHVGALNRHGFGVYIGGQGSTVQHNLIHDVPRGGIFYTGRFLTISRNRIRHCNLEMEDTAAIYGGGYLSNTGTKINGNWVSDSIGFSHDAKGNYAFRKTCAWGIYLDDCSGGAEVVGNLVEHCNGGGMHMHCARFNVVSNNVFVSNGGLSGRPRQHSIRGWKLSDKGHCMVYMRTRAQKSYEELIGHAPAWTNFITLAHPPATPDAPDGYIMQGNRIVNNVWYYPDQPTSVVYGPGNYNVKNNVFDFNVIWPGSTNVLVRHENKDLPFADWRALGQEVHSAIADPLFVDPVNGDYSYRADSPALKLGIVPVRPQEAGLYVNANRPTLPREAEGVREHPEWLQQ